jgi:serine/threonine protein phosphatase PrpC
MLARILSAGRTDVGKKRDSNQDHFLIADLNKSMLVQSTSLNVDAQSRMYGMSHGKLFMVADGMGGHLGGQRASTLAIDLLINQLLNSMHWFFQFDTHEEVREQGFIEDLKRMMQHTHEEIERESHQTENKGMGTTLTMAYVIWPWMYVVHAGDSRCYLLRDDQLRQVTNDHTVSAQLVESGGMSAAEASRSPWNNVLYNALGAGGSAVTTEIHKVQLHPGDSVLLCSDGLNRHVSDEDIRQLLQTELEPNETCRSLIDLANIRGGHDNVTVIVAKLLEPDQNQPRTRVAAEVTLERLLGDVTGYHPREIPTKDTDEHRLLDTVQ